jgi:hypothetical protein
MKEMGVYKLLMIIVLMVAGLNCSATVLSATAESKTTSSSVQKQDTPEFRTINLFYSACKSFSGFILLSDVVNYFHYDHNSYSRKISLFASTDISVFSRSSRYRNGLEQYDYMPRCMPSYSFFCKLQL